MIDPKEDPNQLPPPPPETEDQPDSQGVEVDIDVEADPGGASGGATIKIPL